MTAGFITLLALWTGCPDGSIDETMADRVVQDALDDAWRDSHEGQPDEHEEGGYIYQCRDGDVVRYETARWPPGDEESMSAPDPTPPSGCRTVAWFHTHPGGALADPRSNDDYTSDKVSIDDINVSEDLGIPGIMRYGFGNDPSATTDVTFGSDRPRRPEWQCPRPPLGLINGDPHLETFDHLRYDFQAVGDYVLVESLSGELRAHIRYQPQGDSTVVSVTAALAVDVDGAIIELRPSELLVDGRRATIPRSGGPLQLSGGGQVAAAAGGLTITWSDGSELFAGTDLRTVSLRLADSRMGSVRGLLGDFDLDPSDDLALRSGESLAATAGAVEIHGRFADSWRLHDADESLFTYAPNEGPDTFFVAGYPSDDLTLIDLPPLARERAAATCRQAGVTDPRRFDECVFDVALSGDESYADAAQLSEQRASTAPPVRVPVIRAPDPPLIAAAADRDLVAVTSLVGSGADVNTARSSDGATALLFAAQHGDAAMVWFLLRAGSLPDLTSDEGWTPLSLAAQNGHLDAVNALVAGGAAVDLAQRDGWTPLHAAASHGHVAITSTLLEAGADPDPTGYDDGATPLAFAAEHGYSEVARLLVNAGAQTDRAAGDGWTPLLFAAQNGQLDAIDLLLTAGADPNLGLVNGWRALHAAAAGGHVDAVVRLLRAGANPQLTTEDGRTARDIATAAGHQPVVEVLDAG